MSTDEVLASEPEHIAISKSKGMDIDWKDGHRSHYELEYLREECPCAHCAGTHGTVPLKKQPKPLLAMYKPTLSMLNVEAVGHYAIQIYWNDGHSSGIYSFRHLRQVCPCGECSAVRGALPA